MKSPKAAWFEDRELPDLVAIAREALSDLAVATITMIDSEPEPAGLVSVRAAVEKVTSEGDFRGPAVIVPSEALPLLVAGGLFTGFDEVWFGRTWPLTVSEPKTRVTAETPITDPPPLSVVEWMDAHRCCVGAGDGDGLNVVGSAERVEALRMLFQKR